MSESFYFLTRFLGKIFSMASLMRNNQKILILGIFFWIQSIIKSENLKEVYRYKISLKSIETAKQNRIIGISSGDAQTEFLIIFY